MNAVIVSIGSCLVLVFSGDERSRSIATGFVPFLLRSTCVLLLVFLLTCDIVRYAQNQRLKFAADEWMLTCRSGLGSVKLITSVCVAKIMANAECSGTDQTVQNLQCLEPPFSPCY